ncbi:ZIP family metal transporter [Mycoplasmatota bacterium]|nr:ZIP family metal transporter [Mycoplasmatota bacterium]
MKIIGVIFVEWLSQFNAPTLALLGTLFTYFVTMCGASLVFFFKNVKKEVLDMMLGFGAGVMIAASFWSLLAPAIDIAELNGNIPWIPPLIGFLIGAGFLLIVDIFLPHIHADNEMKHSEGLPTSWNRSILLVLAITLHNIPEGLAIGVAFGAAKLGLEGATLYGAIALAIGIGLQNFPEGAAVSVPLRREGLSRKKSFWYGQLSGIVEPIAGIIGAVLVISMRNLLPYALSFAAGAMIYVVVEELIPESKSNKEAKIATLGAIAGFAIMMTLDVALG